MIHINRVETLHCNVSTKRSVSHLKEIGITRVIDNILHCLKHGCQLGWLLDADDYSVLIFVPGKELEVCRGDCILPTLKGVNLTVTAAQVFAWLQVGRRSSRFLLE